MVNVVLVNVVFCLINVLEPNSFSDSSKNGKDTILNNLMSIKCTLRNDLLATKQLLITKTTEIQKLQQDLYDEKAAKMQLSLENEGLKERLKYLERQNSTQFVENLIDLDFGNNLIPA